MSDQRLRLREAAPAVFAALMRLTETLHAAFPTQTRALVELRVSQINGCAFCCDMHAREARQAGVTEPMLDCLAGWQEADCFDPPTKAALAWAEALTAIRESRAPRALYDEASHHFSDAELATLTVIVGAINNWNRIAIGLRLAAPARR